MNKHKYRKRRQQDVFKRKHLENVRLRKQRTKEQKEQRRQERARGSQLAYFVIIIIIFVDK